MTYLLLFSLFLLFYFWIIPSKSKIESYKIPKENKEIKKLVELIIQWAETNMKMGKKRKIRPLVTISNSKNTKYCGTYNSSNKTIVIYIKNNPDVLTLIDTCIHEYIHHLQLRGINDNSRYNKLTKSKGYWENDYEIEARELATKYKYQCLKALKMV
jgi:hypothetical protein